VCSMPIIISILQHRPTNVSSSSATHLMPRQHQDLRRVARAPSRLPSFKRRGGRPQKQSMVRLRTHPLPDIFGKKPIEAQVQADPEVLLSLLRSNIFFNEMSSFIKSKSGTQCRSHHQKYENKYKYPHRIIKQEKPKMNSKVYAKIEQESSVIRTFIFEDQAKAPQRHKPEKKLASSTVACQTDYQGVNNHLEMWEGPKLPPFWNNAGYNAQPIMSLNESRSWQPLNQFHAHWPFPFY
jgi:hypothetical protein